MFCMFASLAVITQNSFLGARLTLALCIVSLTANALMWSVDSVNQAFCEVVCRAAPAWASVRRQDVNIVVTQRPWWKTYLSMFSWRWLREGYLTTSMATLNFDTLHPAVLALLTRDFLAWPLIAFMATMFILSWLLAACVAVLPLVLSVAFIVALSTPSLVTMIKSLSLPTSAASDIVFTFTTRVWEDQTREE